jgi:hypothetical protein
VPPVVPRQLVIRLKVGDHYLLGLVDTGAEINLINDPAVQNAGLTVLDLPVPTRVSLALNDVLQAPLILKQFTRATFTDTQSQLRFDNVELSLGPIAGNCDMILGIPFLSLFNLSVSISQHSLVCVKSGRCVVDYRAVDATTTKTVSCSPPEITANYPCKQSEATVLGEFSDLFPPDIPAISDEVELEGSFKDGSFPKKMQEEGSKVRHKIILTDPDAQIKERQYTYPQKYMTVWRKLLDQHIEAGRIWRSSSQYDNT